MVRWTLLSAMMVLSLGGCSDTINGKGMAEPEVAQFHKRLKAREFEQMYDSADAEFKSSTSKDKVVALFSAIDRKLGALQDTREINWSVNTRNMVTTVVLVYQSKFNEGEATETFTFNVDDNKALLTGYNISSLDMLIK